MINRVKSPFWCKLDYNFIYLLCFVVLISSSSVKYYSVHYALHFRRNVFFPKRYDTIHGIAKGTVEVEGNFLVLNDRRVRRTVATPRR